MTDLRNVPGVWWLPEAPDRKVPGWFTYDSERGGTLRLAGSMRPLNWVENPLAEGSVQRFIGRRPDEDRIYPRIHAHSKPLLLHLERAFQTSLQEQLCREEDAAEEVHVDWLITGALFDAEGEPQVGRAVIDLQNLTSWVDNDAFTTEWRDLPDGVFRRVQADQLPTLKADLHAGMELGLIQSLFTGGDHGHDVSLSQWVLVLLTLQTQGLRPTHAFIDRVSNCEDLLTIATGKIANIEKFHFTHTEVPKLSLPGTPMGNWRYSPTMFVEDRVFNCVAAPESFDRVRRDTDKSRVDLVVRLRNCVELAGEAFADLLGPETVDEWAERAKNHRHALGHHLDRFRDNTDLVGQALGEQLFWLAVMCFLREAEAPDAVFTGIRKSPGFRWVVRLAAPKAMGGRTDASC